MLTSHQPLAGPLRAIVHSRIFFAQFGSQSRRRSRGDHRRCLHNKEIILARPELLPNPELS